MQTNTPADALLARLRRAPDETYSECIIAWLNDLAMETMHYPLLGVLATCGGSAAGAYLSSYYEGLVVKERGIVRALDYYFQPTWQSPLGHAEETGQPWATSTAQAVAA